MTSNVGDKARMFQQRIKCRFPVLLCRRPVDRLAGVIWGPDCRTVWLFCRIWLLNQIKSSILFGELASTFLAQKLVKAIADCIPNAETAE